MRRICVVVAMAMCLGSAAALIAQQAPPGTTAAPAGTPSAGATGVVAGVITSSDLNQPVRKASVHLFHAATRTSRTTTTDADGRFEVANVPAGDHTLTAGKPGYLEMVYGARRPGAGSPGVAITIAAGQRLDKIAMQLPRGSVITGTITDEFGDPVFNIPVRAMRYIYRDGYRALTSGGNATTDDRGIYRIAGLIPGEYLVSAVPRDTVATTAAAAESLRDRLAQIGARGNGPAPITAPPMPSSTGYVVVHYPGSASGGASSPVTVGAATEVGAIDLRLQVLQTASISGSLSSTESVLPQTRLQLIDKSMPLSTIGVWFRDMRSDGSFSFHGLVPGSYLLKGFGTPGGEAGVAGGEMWGSTEITLDARGTADVQLRMQRGVTITGRLAFDGLPPSVDRSRLRVVLQPVLSPSDWEMGPVSMTPDAEGALTARNVVPAMYRVTVTGAPAGWVVDRALFEQKDAADLHLAIDGSRNLAGLDISLTSKRAELSGTITNGAGAPVTHHTVVLFPNDRTLWIPRSRRIQVSQPGADGRYAFRDLPPGEYRIVAVPDLDPGRTADPEWLSQTIGAATLVTLADGEKRGQDLRVR